MSVFFIFFFNDTATTEIYTLSLHDALPICVLRVRDGLSLLPTALTEAAATLLDVGANADAGYSAIRRAVLSGEITRRLRRSEEHTSELQSPCNLVCRLLLEKKKKLGWPCYQ